MFDVYTLTNPTGYLAESRHRHSLRGLDIPVTTICDSSSSFRPNRFMPKERRTDTLVRYDYTNLLPFLGMGLKDNVLIEKHNSERNPGDIVLTVVAALQKRLQNDMKHEIEGNSNYSSKKNLRASVVVLDELNRVNEAIDALPPLSRRVLRMNAYDGCSGQEIAEATGLSEANVRVILSRTRKRLRTLFSK